ncbi:hypothetical protein HB662_01185 [Roseomonas frigidaquae]|uniref:Uncharacterized protein n=1 Tax=Falsiroseomonas frigidaquae TaxID=487318 RepID=A0ABX1ESU5_9PROT|nr:hypothetical protein [Falsiroseomonas frigidaquae]NKE43373.1 hypothetical protein [Falsiroseomonas frigidaquae]
MVASDMLPAVYADGRYLRRWSLIGGHPRCILPPLVLAEATPAEVAAAEATNARIHGLAAAAEALEAQAALAAQPPPDLPGHEADAWQAARQAVEVASPKLLALIELRQGEPPGPPVSLALIDAGGTVVNVLAVDPGWEPDPSLAAVPLGPDARVGATYAEGVFTPPPVPAPVPAEVTLRQLLFALVGAGWITEAEALAAARTGEVPASLADILPDLSEAEQSNLRLTWAAMYSAERSSSVWDLFISAGVATAEQVDDLFRAAGQVA